MRKALMSWVVVLVLFTWVGTGPRESQAAAGGQQEGAAQEEALEDLPGEGFQDGTYTATYDEPDERGWRAEIEVVVQDGRIVQVNYDEVDAGGLLKSQDEAYAQRMEADSGVTPAEAQEELEARLAAAQSAQGVDEVSGATGTSRTFVELASVALEAAREGRETQVVVPRTN